MKRRAFLFLLLLVLSLAPVSGLSEICLRVVARDDSPEAQAEKLRVRDTVLSLLPGDERLLPLAWPLLQKAAEKQADCHLSLRLYTPPGQKTPRLTVYLVIGRGEGKNWFGVLYPETLLLCGEKTEEETVIFYFPLLSFLFSVLTEAPEAPAGW